MPPYQETAAGEDYPRQHGEEIGRGMGRIR